MTVVAPKLVFTRIRSSYVRPRNAFTLTELLAVIGVIGIILAATISLVGTNSGAKARKGAKKELLAILTRARAEAISTGNPVAVAIAGTKDGPDSIRGRRLSMYEARQNEATGNWELGIQLRRWLEFQAPAILLDSTNVHTGANAGINVLDEQEGLPVEIHDRDSGRRVRVIAPCIIFEPSGAIAYPSGSGRLGFYIGEGTWHKAKLTILSRDQNGKAVSDLVVLNRFSGRAQGISTQ